MTVPDDTPDPPTEAELARIAEPATLRRAPRFGAFITAGALVGALVGLVLAIVTGPGSELSDGGSGLIGFLDGQGSIRLISALALAGAGALIGGGLAVWADRRSVRAAGRVRP